jgi:hypothetical protein
VTQALSGSTTTPDTSYNPSVGSVNDRKPVVLMLDLFSVVSKTLATLWTATGYFELKPVTRFNAFSRIDDSW